MKLTVFIDEEEIKILKKRAKKNLLTLKEQVEDIIRRSCINSKKTSYAPMKTDDALIEVFSRRKVGRKRKKF